MGRTHFFDENGAVTGVVESLPWQYDDGGRADAGYRGHAGDCVVRAVAIATGRPYQAVYDAFNGMAPTERRTKRQPKKSNARTGVRRATLDKYLTAAGWGWVPTMRIGSGCRVHLRTGELPGGRLVVSLSRHIVAVVDGVVRDTYDPARDGTRCVYGYWTAPENAPRNAPETLVRAYDVALAIANGA